MSASTPLQLAPEDKLDLLRYLDEFHFWHSLDDKRHCKRCSRTITGRQILVIELQGTRGKLRLQCPTAGCVSAAGDWAYANPVQAAQLRAESRPSDNGQHPRTAADARMHHRGRAPKGKTRSACKHSSIFAPAASFRAALARLLLLRPLATALHAFRPIA
jgi:hypothetical protein